MVEFNKTQKDHVLSVGKKFGFTVSENNVFIKALEGKTLKEAGEELFTSEQTVKFHLTSVYKKTKLKRRSELFWLLGLKWPDEIGSTKESISF